MDKDLLAQQEVRDLCTVAAEAQAQFASFTQEEVDHVCEAMVKAGFKASARLAESAVADTGMGRVEDKILKNEFATRDLWDDIKDLKTVGVIETDRRRKVTTIAEPMGVIAAIIPTTNPTSTVMYKAIIAVKSRNALIASPHPTAGRCTIEALKVLADASVRAGAPQGLLACIGFPSIAAANALMNNEQVAIILSTGGSAIVRAAHSTGKPAIGVGPGNVPAYIDKSADVSRAVHNIMLGKSFDWGVICSSEQAMIVDRAVEKRVEEAIRQRPIYWVKGAERDQLEKLMVYPNGKLNTQIVGQSPRKIAQMAGFTVPEDTLVLLVKQDGVGKEFPLSREKLSPVLAYYTVNGAREGIDIAMKIISYGGVGHTASVHATDRDVIDEYARRIQAFRVIVNSPATHGSVGYTTGLQKGMTLGCGTWGGAITGDNISALHLINKKRVAEELVPADADATGHDGLSRRGAYSKYDDLSLPKPGNGSRIGSSDEAVSPDDVERIAREFAEGLKT